jgi:type IV secretory pathway VirB4 component
MQFTPYPELKRRFNWAQGEHVVIVGPTGVGKSTVIKDLLLPKRKANLFFGTKIKDPLYDELLQKRGYHRVDSLSEVRPWHKDKDGKLKVLLWPHKGKNIAETMGIQKVAFGEAMNDIATHERPWTLILDEGKYLAEQLHLSKEISYCIEQFRTIDGTIVCGAQRPAWIPPSVMANSSWGILYKSTNRDDAQKLADMGGLDGRQIKEELMKLGPHEFLVVHTRGTETELMRSQVELRK